MDTKLLARLKVWRLRQSVREGVEPYRVLSTAALEEIARVKPTTKEAFFLIKGFKEAKWRRYGAMLFPMVADAAVGDIPSARNQENLFDVSEITAESAEKIFSKTDSLTVSTADDDIYSVGSFLDVLNDSFAGLRVRIRGEVSSVDIRERVVYFTLKDRDGESALSCLIFRSQYGISGVVLEIGQEIVIKGGPEIWKPTGRLSFKATLIELVGEGALKKAYDELYKKLEREGFFASERKRALPEFPSRIALITSREGAAIGDFMMNVGQYGYHIDLYPSSVEGKRAVPELLSAFRQVSRNADRYDVLVMIRGGGSLESLQAFNNETLVREVATLRIPVLAGIGHEKDVSLVALAADGMVSTPTATARVLRESWDGAVSSLDRATRSIVASYMLALETKWRRMDCLASSLARQSGWFRERFIVVEERLRQQFGRLCLIFDEQQKKISEYRTRIGEEYATALTALDARIRRTEETLARHDPRRLLRLGYSLAFKNGRLIRSASDVSPGERIMTRVWDGDILSDVVAHDK